MMLSAFEDMGLAVDRFDPQEDMKNIRFIYR